MKTAARSSPAADADGERYAAWFHELDAWTEYWDLYHPETRGRYYFGDGADEPGLLTLLLPRSGRPPLFTAWIRLATETSSREARDAFAAAVSDGRVACAVLEVDALIARLYARHFGDPCDVGVQADYLQALFRFATDSLPAAAERDARVPEDDPRKSTAGRHALEGDLMWFAWALQIEAAAIVAGNDAGQPRRALMLAGAAMGCGADFCWRGHRRTRPEYRRDAASALLLRQRGLDWAGDFGRAADEIHALYRIREWGDDA